MSAGDVGETVGVSERQLHRYEADKYEPSIETLDRLAVLYGTTVDRLLKAAKRTDEAA